MMGSSHLYRRSEKGKEKMPILSIKPEKGKCAEVHLKEINNELNEILKDSNVFHSPQANPIPEHPMDTHTGHIRAGSEVFVANNMTERYVQSQDGNLQDHITFTFLVKLDEDQSGHSGGEHWNIRIYKTLHSTNGVIRKEKTYKLPKIENIDHIKDSDWIIIEVENDDRTLLCSRKFSKKQTI
jgi:hypothetical protein